MQERGIPSKPYLYRWGLMLPKTFDEWLAELTENEEYQVENAVEYYGKIYDANFAAHIKALRSKSR